MYQRLVKFILTTCFFIFFLNIRPGQVEPVSSCHKMMVDLALKEWALVRPYLDTKRCPIESQVLKWAALYRGDKTATFHEYIAFISQHPDWPWLARIKTHAEKRALTGQAPEVIKWFEKHPPQTFEGTEAYSQALYHLPLKERIRRLKKIWATLPLSPKFEASLYKVLNPYLQPADIAARAYFYLDRQQPYEAQRWLKGIGKKDRNLIEERIRLQTGCSPREPLSSDINVVFDALVYYRKQNHTQAFSLLNRYKKQLYGFKPEKVWKEVHILIRRAFEDSDYATALALLKGYHNLSGPSYAEALWLEGWLEAKNYRNFKKAISLFQRMHAYVKTPISRAKAAFWTAEAYAKGGKSKEARAWLQKAAAFPTTFYGQEALIKLNRPLRLPPDPQPSIHDIQVFNRRSLVQAAKALLRTPLEKEFKDFLYIIVKTSPSYAHALLALKLAQQHLPLEVVDLAKTAGSTFNKEIYGPLAFPLLPASFIKIMKEEGIDSALVHAVIRKESAFNPRLISPANARGLMQVLPGTAKMMAPENKGEISARLIQDPLFNVRVGSRYLKKNLNNYDGCLTLTLAAYNAGPKWASNWKEIFGNPNLSTAQRLTWMEVIPFAETRNYLHRVIEGMRVYHYRLQRQQG